MTIDEVIRDLEETIDEYKTEVDLWDRHRLERWEQEVVVLKEIEKEYNNGFKKGYKAGKVEGFIKGLAKSWISCEKEMPKDLEIVNIVWVNHNPEPYYKDIKDKPFVASGVRYRDNWYWYSSTVVDYLKEYGKADFDLIDKDIEITYWMPLAEPPRKEKGNDN